MNTFTKKKWVIINLIAFVISYCIYSLIAHGFTGGHEHYLSPSQLLSHTIALFVVGLIVGYFQHSQLTEFFKIKLSRIILTPVFFIAFFWIGYYLSGPPLDIILGFPVLGSILWVFNKRITKLKLKYKILAYSSFLIGSIGGIIMLILSDILFGIVSEIQESIVLHTVIWLVLAIPTAIIGGFLSGVSIEESIKNSEHNTT